MEIARSEGWFSAPSIYVENIRDRDSAYHVKSEEVLESLEAVCRPKEVVCRFSDERDLEAFRRADILITGALDRLVISNEAENLKLIQYIGAGVEGYTPLDWLPPTVTLTNASGVHAAKAGEFGLMATMMLHERVPWIATNQRERSWQRQLRGLAAGRNVTIYGVGALGGAIAERLQAVGFRITGVRRSGEPHPHVDRMVTPDRFLDELPATDILILTCPLTPETRGLIGAAAIAALPKGASLLNIARAGIIDHEALVASLENGHLSGAILDVFDKEPLPTESQLWGVPNLMIFPHISSSAPEGYIDRCLAILVDNIERSKLGRPMRNRVDPTAGY